jgi:RNA polymerase sigma-70 factor (ECF subfamily)
MTDASQFEAFVRRYQDMVFATAVRLLGSHAEAEDAAQTVFLRAFQRFAEIGTSPAAAGWLKTTTRNVCLNHLSRYRARWSFFSELTRTDDRDGAGYEATIAADGSHALDFERADRHERLEHAIRRLPDHQRVPLVLFHFEEATYQEIADALGVSLGKIKTDIHRGREALRDLLSSDDEHA